MSRNGQHGTCSTCRFWSEMIAQSIGGGPLEAMCLAHDGPNDSRMMPATGSCDGYKPNTLGAIDDPPNYGSETQAAYIQEEGADALKPAGQEAS